jgi:hypothetical protein
MSPEKTLWVVRCERTEYVTVLAWAETQEEAESFCDGALEDCCSHTHDHVLAKPVAVRNGKVIAAHDMGRADPCYSSDDEEITVAEAIAVMEGNISALPEHLAALVRQRKEANNGQLPLIP